MEYFAGEYDVVVIGAGDTAAEEATYLANICKKVTILVRKDYMRASKAMQHRVNQTENIEIMFNTELDEVLGEQVVEGVRVFNNINNEKQVKPLSSIDEYLEKSSKITMIKRGNYAWCYR